MTWDEARFQQMQAALRERSAERQLERKLGLRLIKIGNRLLRKELRPIKGKREPWERQLRRARERLRAAV